VLAQLTVTPRASCLKELMNMDCQSCRDFVLTCRNWTPIHLLVNRDKHAVEIQGLFARPATEFWKNTFLLCANYCTCGRSKWWPGWVEGHHPPEASFAHRQHRL